MTTCRWDAEAGDYLTGAGDPCRRDDYGDPTHHCQARRTCSLHVGPGELTCARCLGRTRVDLAQIVERSALLPPEAEHAGVDSEAASLAGPAADPEAWSWRKVAARQGRAWHVSLVEDDDEVHPTPLLERWQWCIGEDYGHERVEGLAAAAAYLDRHLGRIAQDPGQDFPLLARELRRCRSHLEAVLRDSRTPPRGVPCPDCTSSDKGLGPRLVRVYGHWCEDPECCKEHYLDETADRWECPRNPQHQWAHHAYVAYLEERRGA